MKTLVVLFSVSVIALAQKSNAAAIVSTAVGGDWHSNATWADGIVPGAVDTVVIEPGAFVTISSAAVCASLELQNSPLAGAMLTVTAGNSLVVGNGTGDVTLGLSATIPSTDTETSLKVAGMLVCSNLVVQGRGDGPHADALFRITGPDATALANGDVVLDTDSGTGVRADLVFDEPGTLEIKGSIVEVNSGGRLVQGTGTVNFCGEGAQSIADFDYYKLVLSGSGAKTSTGRIGIEVYLSLGGAATYVGSRPDYHPGATLRYWGTVPQIMGNSELPLVIPTHWNLSISNAAGVTMNRSVICKDLDLIEGIVTTESHVLTVDRGTTRVNGYVVGNLRKAIGTGSGVVKTFEVGTPGGYKPILLNISNVLTPGYVLGRVDLNDHPSIGTSILRADRSVNLHWTLQEDSGFTLNTCIAKFWFEASDLDPNTGTTNLIMGRHSQGSWTYPPVLSRTSVSVRSSGVTAFGKFQLAEGGQIPVGQPILGIRRAPQGQALISVLEPKDVPFVIEATDILGSGQWTNVGTTSVDGDGFHSRMDLMQPGGHRFYRARNP
jgi:hypothetical protein